MAVVNTQQFKHLIVKNTDFFGDKKKFHPLKDDLGDLSYNDIHDVELECLGYGHFDPEQVLERFEMYCMDILTNCKSVRSFKIQVNGFDLGADMGHSKLFHNLSNKLVEAKDSLKTLWIHTSHLMNCTLTDFESLLFLSSKIGNLNFEQISLQFSYWKFMTGPPQKDKIAAIFKSLLQDNPSEMSKLENRKFRLELSGWFYDLFEAKWFLGFALNDDEIEENGLTEDFGTGYEADDEAVNDAVERFHKQFTQLMQGLIQTMHNLQDFEIDFRNWNDFLKMKALKKKLDNVKKDNTIEKSLVSKKQQFVDPDEKELRMAFVM